MPSAGEELQDKMRNRFGGIGPEGPVNFLEDKGWVFASDGSYTMSPPAGKSHAEITDDEWDCIDFLGWEWYFGGVDAPEGWYPAKHG